MIIFLISNLFIFKYYITVVNYNFIIQVINQNRYDSTLNIIKPLRDPVLKLYRYI